jgi:hypothetical protein
VAHSREIKGEAELAYNPKKGKVVAPPALGPYLWADGITLRQSDGLVWQRTDFEKDGVSSSLFLPA